MKYLNNLLKLLTEKQPNLFNRMYPDGVKPSQIKWATTQVENTLKKLNSTSEELQSAKKELEVATKEFETKASKMKKDLENSEKELEQAYSDIKKLENPTTSRSKSQEDDLELLYALQAAGVDNWEGYEFALENLRS